MNKIPLTKSQSEIMSRFYSAKKTRVIFSKKEREEIWNTTKKKDTLENFNELEEKCPALVDQIQKSYQSGNNIQPAVFSECVYTQTLANVFKLNKFFNLSKNSYTVCNNIAKLLKAHNLVPRYTYAKEDNSKILIQAGSCRGIDSALITVENLNIFTIEFKEPYSKASEVDLPKYGEDGLLTVTSDFEKQYPQFHNMLDEQAGLNFFNVMGHNINDFRQENIRIAVNNNYTDKKYADVICTEDKENYLVMFPANQASLWGKLTGEIRPAGRNHGKVWTPLALKNTLRKLHASFKQNEVSIEKNKLEIRRQRGGGGKASGYKISPLFFIYADDCEENNEIVQFNLSKVQQLIPTITAKMDFRGCDYEEIKNYYGF